MLNLEILAGGKIQFSVSAILSQVPRPVDRLRIPGIQRVLHKGFRRFFRIVIIAQPQTGTLYADFADPALLFCGNQAVFFRIQQKNFRVVKGRSDRKIFFVGKRPVHNIVRTIAGDLRRAVKIHILCLVYSLPPVIEHLDRHDLPGKHDQFQIPGTAFGKSFEICHNAQGRNRPDDYIHPPFIQIRNQLPRKREKLLGDDLHRSAQTKSIVYILHRHVKIKRRLVSENRVFGERKGFPELFHQINHTAVTDQHPLGDSRGAGRKNRIQRIRIQRAPAHRFQPFRANLPAADHIRKKRRRETFPRLSPGGAQYQHRLQRI